MALVLGWRQRAWRCPTLCRRCRGCCTDGFTHVNDVESDPPVNALCLACHAFVMGMGEGERDPLITAGDN